MNRNPWNKKRNAINNFNKFTGSLKRVINWQTSSKLNKKNIQLFQRKKFLNSFYMARLSLISNPDKDSLRKKLFGQHHSWTKMQKISKQNINSTIIEMHRKDNDITIRLSLLQQHVW